MIKPKTPISWATIYGIEIAIITTVWFCVLTIILSLPRVKRILEKIEQYISKLLGTFLIGFGVTLAMYKNQ